MGIKRTIDTLAKHASKEDDRQFALGRTIDYNHPPLQRVNPLQNKKCIYIFEFLCKIKKMAKTPTRETQQFKREEKKASTNALREIRRAKNALTTLFQWHPSTG